MHMIDYIFPHTDSGSAPIVQGYLRIAVASFGSVWLSTQIKVAIEDRSTSKRAGEIGRIDGTHGAACSREKGKGKTKGGTHHHPRILADPFTSPLGEELEPPTRIFLPPSLLISAHTIVAIGIPRDYVGQRAAS